MTINPILFVFLMLALGGAGAAAGLVLQRILSAGNLRGASLEVQRKLEEGETRKQRDSSPRAAGGHPTPRRVRTRGSRAAR